MRRIAAFTAIFMCLFCLVCSAKEAGFSCEYTPKSEKSSIFYIDVICEQEVSAAVFSLDYDADFVSFRSVQASEKSTTLRSNESDGRVDVALADSGSIKGTLCRMTFQALDQGETSFILNVSQAADASLTKTSAEEYTLTVTFDKDGVATSTSSSSGKKKSSSSSSSSSSSKSSKSSSSSGGRSNRSRIWDNGGDDSSGGSGGGYYDLRPDRTWTYIMIGAGSMILLAAGVGVTIYLMKKKKPQPEYTDSPSEPMSDEETPDGEKDKLIEELNDEVLDDTQQDE